MMLLTAWIVIWNYIMLGMAILVTLMIFALMFSKQGRAGAMEKPVKSAFVLCVLLGILWLAGYGAGVLVCEW